MGDQLALVPTLGIVPPHDEINAMIARAGIRKSSIVRYSKSARSWLTYCADRHLDPANADTNALLAWLDSRVRAAESPRSMVRISLAAACAVQRVALADRGDEFDPTPYKASSRPRLAAWIRSATLDTVGPRRAPALRLDDLVEVAGALRNQCYPRPGVTYARAVRLLRRDLAALLVSWWAGARMDDLANLRWRHVAFVPQGMEITFERHKTSRRTGPRVCALASRPERNVCPVLALREWATETQFAADESVFELSRAHLHRAVTNHLRGLAGPAYTPHSLRAGFATECAAQKIPDAIAMEHARWLSVQQYREYVRLGRLWVDNPTMMLCVNGDETK